MNIPTVQICIYTRYNQAGKLLAYAPWLQAGTNPEDAARDCFGYYGADLKKDEWDCVDVCVWDMPRFLLSIVTPVTVISSKKIRRIRRSKEARG